MGLFDFLGQDVAGYAQGPMPSGAAGVPRSGVTWGDIANVALQGGKSGQSPFNLEAFKGLLGQPQGVSQVPTLQQQQKQKSQQSMQSALSLVASLYGFGA